MVAGFMTDAGVSWRWVFWLLAIFTGSCTVLVFFTMPETYESVSYSDSHSRTVLDTIDVQTPFGGARCSEEEKGDR